MKRYDIITEADARSIDVGTSIALAPSGHITPLASDTLRARRVTVIRDLLDPDEGSLAPVADIRRVAIGSDHSGVALKGVLVELLRGLGLAVEDVGTNSTEPVDYPDYAKAVGKAVQRGQVERGILVCGSGVGACVAANKLQGIRAALCHDTYTAHQGVEHDDVNVLCLGGRVVGPALAFDILKAWLGARFSEGERHRRRVAKIIELEKTE